MKTVTMSSKFQVTIPLAARKFLNLQPGQKIQVVLYQGRIELIPIKSIQEMRGFLFGIDSSIEREPDRI